MGMYDSLTIEKGLFKPNFLLDKYKIFLEDLIFQTKSFEEPALRFFRIVKNNHLSNFVVEVNENGDELLPEDYEYGKETLFLNERLYELYDYSDPEVERYKDFEIEAYEYFEEKEGRPFTGEIFLRFNIKEGYVKNLRGRIVIDSQINDEWLREEMYLVSVRDEKIPDTICL